VAMALPLAWQIVNISGWVAWQVTAIFENIGVVQEGMMTIARPIALTDRPQAQALAVTRGEIAFEDVRFHYGRTISAREEGRPHPHAVLEGFSLKVRPGEKIGLIGRSGAGKSTVVNLLLRFFDLEGGRILIDGQDIAAVTQESLRAQIAVVTQDTSLLHRSIRDNIRYGRPDSSDAEVIAAARLAHADEFILDLVDWKERRGYDAQVGERGVKLSGGQRQRIAIARVILRNAPILVLDEATSALDSEVEAAIQSSLGTLMAGKSCSIAAASPNRARTMSCCAATGTTPRCGSGSPAASSTPTTCRPRGESGHFASGEDMSARTAKTSRDPVTRLARAPTILADLDAT